MKLLITFIMLLLAGFRAEAQPRHFNMRHLTGFYLDDKVPLKEGLNFMVISNRRDFIKHFGLINKPDTPNFQFHHVVVMAMRPTRKQYFLDFEQRATKAGNYIEVYCSVRQEKHKLTYLDRPIVTASIPRYFSVGTVNFYDRETKKLLESVQIR